MSEAPAIAESNLSLPMEERDRVRLERLIDRMLGSGFAMAAIETPWVGRHREFASWLKSMAERESAEFAVIDVSKMERYNFWFELGELHPKFSDTERRIWLFIGFESSLELDEEGDEPSVLRQLNVQRDLFRRDYPATWILLLHPRTADKLRVTAPDFCDFIRLWCDGNKDEKIVLMDRPSPIIIPDFTNSTPSDHYTFGNFHLWNAFKAIDEWRLDEAGDWIERYKVGKVQNALPGALELVQGALAVRRGQLRQARELFEKSRNRIMESGLESPPNRNLMILLLSRSANLYISLGEFGNANSELGQSLLLSQNCEDRNGEAIACNQLARLAALQGDYASAREMHNKVLKWREARGDLHGQAVALHFLGHLDKNQGDYRSAEDKFTKVLKIAQHIGDRTGEAVDWNNLGNIDRIKKKYSAAREKYFKALLINQETKDSLGEALTWHHLAHIDIDEGDFAAALEKFEKALAICRFVGDHRGEALIWSNIADIDFKKGNLGAARKKYESALKLRQAIGDRIGEANTWHQLANIDLSEGNESAARVKFDSAVKIKQAIEQPTFLLAR